MRPVRPRQLARLDGHKEAPEVFWKSQSISHRNQPGHKHHVTPTPPLPQFPVFCLPINCLYHVIFLVTYSPNLLHLLKTFWAFAPPKAKILWSAWLLSLCVLNVAWKEAKSSTKISKDIVLPPIHPLHGVGPTFLPSIHRKFTRFTRGIHSPSLEV